MQRRALTRSRPGLLFTAGLILGSVSGCAQKPPLAQKPAVARVTPVQAQPIDCPAQSIQLIHCPG